MTEKSRMVSAVFLSGLVLLGASGSRAGDQSTIRDEKIRYIPGTMAQYLPDPLFYDTTVPVLFDFAIPRHMETAVKLMWDHAVLCNSSDSRYDGKLCPVVFHLHKIVTNLSNDMGFWRDIYPPLTIDPDLIPLSYDPGKPSFSSVELCDDVKPHFTHYTDGPTLSKYESAVKSCHLGDLVTKVSFDHSWIIDKSTYYTMIDRFYNEYYRHLPSTGSVDWAVTLNSYTSLQGILLSNNFMESSRLLHAYLACQSGKLPESFVKKQVLLKTLSELRVKLGSAHYRPVLTDAASYYKLPLADCTFTDNYKFVVRLLVPVKLEDEESKLLEISTIPFVKTFGGVPIPGATSGGGGQNYTQLCVLKAPSRMRMIESNSGLLFETGCESGSLCKTSGLNSFYQSDACVSAVLSNSESQIKTHCALSCFPVEMKTLPLFYKVGPDTFVAVGTSSHKVFITCNGQPFEMLTLKDRGALQIKLACNCRITYRNRVFRPQTACGNQLKVEALMPFHWQPKGETGNDASAASLIDNGVSSLQDSSGFSPEDQVRNLIQGGFALSTGVVVQITLLWILIVVLVASNAFLLYHVYILVKWKEFQHYKDTRIVYNVPDSPKMTNKF